MRWSLAAALTALVVFSFAPAPGGATPPVTQEDCGVATSATVFLPWDTQLENLAFDGHGRLFLSDIGADRIVRVLPDGSSVVVFQGDGVHGLTLGPDGHLYIGAEEDGTWAVWRATDASATNYTTYASGLAAVNGMAFDADGHLFVSNPLGAAPPYLVRVPADDPAAWTPWDDRYGPNGLWFDHVTGTMFAAITGDQSSPLVTVDTTTPAMDVIATLSFGAMTLQPGVHPPEGAGQPLVPKGLDDLTVGPDGMVYVAAHVTGEILRIDPTSGSACLLASGFAEPTSLRFATGFGAHDGDLFVTDMGGIGVTALVGPGAGTLWRIDLA